MVVHLSRAFEMWNEKRFKQFNHRISNKALIKALFDCINWTFDKRFSNKTYNQIIAVEPIQIDNDDWQSQYESNINQNGSGTNQIGMDIRMREWEMTT